MSCSFLWSHIYFEELCVSTQQKRGIQNANKLSQQLCVRFIELKKVKIQTFHYKKLLINI